MSIARDRYIYLLSSEPSPLVRRYFVFGPKEAINEGVQNLDNSALQVPRVYYPRPVYLVPVSLVLGKSAIKPKRDYDRPSETRPSFEKCSLLE